MPGFTFDEQSVRRIVRSVLTTERRDRSRQVRGKRPRQFISTEGFDRIQCTAVSAFTSSASTFIVENVVATKGPSPLDDPDSATETMEIHNAFNWDGDAGALVYAEYHANDESTDPKDRWYAYQVECPST